MRVAMYSTWFVILLTGTCAQLEHYKTYHLESFCNSKDEGEIRIPAWGAAILKLGHRLEYGVTSAGIRTVLQISDCTISVKAEEGFSLALVVEHMNIRGIKDRTTNKMACYDYVMFSTVGKFRNLANKFIPGNPFKSRTSKQLCGKAHNSGDNIGDIKLENISTSDTQGNIFHTKNSNIEVVFHQNKYPYQNINNSFTLILTAYKRTLTSCEGRLRCPGSDVYCVNEAFECDNHINCAFPNNGGDEDHAKCLVQPQPTFSTVTTIMIILACLFGAALIICYLYVLKSKRKTTTEYPMDNINSSQREEMSEALPMYEAVAASNAEYMESIKNEPTPVDPKDVPPSYDQLFPEGPPKKEEGVEMSHATEASATDLTLPSGTESADGNPKIPVIGFENI